MKWILEILGAAWLRQHPDWGETFSEWKLFEFARAAYNLFQKKLGCWQSFEMTMAESCDYANPKIVNTIVLQCIVHCTQSVVTNIWDGMHPDDLQMVVLELTKLCVTCFISD